MYKFTIIIPLTDETYLESSINSIINQTIDFKQNIQIIILDNSSNEIALKFRKKYLDNILILNELELDKIDGEYVNFSTSSTVFQSNVFKHLLNYSNNIISITSNKQSINDYTACFFKKDLLTKPFMDFFELNRLLIHSDYVIVNEDYDKLLDENISIEYFTDYLENQIFKLINYSNDKLGFIPDIIKYNIAYDLTRYYNTPASDILSKNELNEFQNKLSEVLSYIDDEFIINNNDITPNPESFLIFLKNNDFYIETRKDDVLLKSKDYTINSLKNKLIIVDIIEVIDNVLNISLCFSSNCDWNHLRIEAIKTNDNNSKEIYCGKFFNYPTTNRYPIESIGYYWYFNYSCDFKIPLKFNEKSRINFNLIYNENGSEIRIKNPLEFQNYDAGLSKVSNYLIKDNHMVIYHNESIIIQKYSFIKSCKLELISILKMIKDHNSSTLPAIFYHLLFLFAFPLMRNKRIWLFQDRVDEADDNAKHLFEYAIQQEDNIEKYFIISKDCEDYGKMKHLNSNIIPLGSFKNKFLYLFADKMISSHVNHSWLNPFFNPKHPYYNGLLTVEKCFLQHGVIKDDLSSWFRKYFQNLHLFLTSSDYERESILGETYNYDESVVKAFGLPRHDNLKYGKVKREILFTPTWRKNLVNRTIFEKSQYFKRLNSFLNNQKLLEYLKKHDYKLIFKPHYDLIPFLDLFNIDGNVEVNTHDSYQELFNNSAVLITDYSSVFFDFAFLKKPIIYYHEGNDYHYQKGYFNYDTMGFGDVVESQDDLVDKIIYYIENDCQMEDKYKKRVGKFFKYTDQKNCKRVYEWLQNH